MAYDKVVDSSVLNGYFSDIADAIRGKLGTQETYTPAQMANAIDSIPVAAVLDHIAVTHAPNKVTYNANQYFNKSGMVVTAYYSDGTSEVVTGYTYSPTGTLNASNTEITITYSSKGITKTCTQAITVNRINASISYISYDLGGKVAIGGTKNIYVSTSSTGAISATSADSSKLTVNSVSGKNISVTKQGTGTVQLTINIAQTDVYNSYSRTYSITIESVSVYDGDDNKVTELSKEYQGNMWEPIHVEWYENYYLWKDGSEESITGAGASDFLEGCIANKNNYFTIDFNVDYYYEDYHADHVEKQDTIVVKYNGGQISIPVTLILNFYN